MIKGEYVNLRAIEYDDLDVLLNWRNNSEFRKYFREFKELNSTNQKNWFENIVLKAENALMFSIINKKNELIGACGLGYIDWINRNADLSIYIGHNNEYIDDKYAPDTTKLLLKYGFNELNLHRIYVEIYDTDFKKKELIENLNFKLDGTHRETHWGGGKWCDSLFYSMLKKEFL
jgi:RimJ/RimL family protein N-acetyltransferase